MVLLPGASIPRGGKMAGYKIHLKVTVQELSYASGKSERMVRRDIKMGKLNPSDLMAVHRWLLKHGKKEEAEVGSG